MIERELAYLALLIVIAPELDGLSKTIIISCQLLLIIALEVKRFLKWRLKRAMSQTSN